MIDGVAILWKEMSMVCFKVLCLEVSVDREKPCVNGSGQSIFEVRYDSGTDETRRGLANRRTPDRLYTPLLLRLPDILFYTVSYIRFYISAGQIGPDSGCGGNISEIIFRCALKRRSTWTPTIRTYSASSLMAFSALGRSQASLLMLTISEVYFPVCDLT